MKTKVHMMTAPEVETIPFDVADFMPEDNAPAFAHERNGAPDIAATAIWEDLPV